MDGDSRNDNSSESSLDYSMNSTLPLSSSGSMGEASGLVPQPGTESALATAMTPTILASRGSAGAEAAGESAPSAQVETESPSTSALKSVRPESSSKVGSFFISEAFPSRNMDLSMMSTFELSWKSESLFSESSIGPVLSPGYEEQAHREIDSRLTPVELRTTATPGRGEVVGDLSGEGGLVYTNDPVFQNRSVSLALVSPFPSTNQKEKTLSSFDEATPDEIRLTSTPAGGRIMGDLGEEGGHLFRNDLEPKMSVSGDPCSPVPFPRCKDAE